MGGQEERRPKRQCVSRRSVVPSAIHYVGYVEDEETPEMIMRKFEELEKVMAAAKGKQQAGAASGKAGQADSNKENINQASKQVGCSSSAPVVPPDSAEPDGPDAASLLTIQEPASCPANPPVTEQPLDESLLLQVFKQTSMFNVRTALSHNAVLMAKAAGAGSAKEPDTRQPQAAEDDTEALSGPESSLTDDEERDLGYLQGFWSDDEFFEKKSKHSKKSKKSSKQRAGSVPRDGKDNSLWRAVGMAARERNIRQQVVMQYNKNTHAMIRRRVRLQGDGKEDIVQMRIPRAPIPTSWGRTIKPYDPTLPITSILLPPPPHMHPLPDHQHHHQHHQHQHHQHHQHRQHHQHQQAERHQQLMGPTLSAGASELAPGGQHAVRGAEAGAAAASNQCMGSPGLLGPEASLGDTLGLTPFSHSRGLGLGFNLSPLPSTFHLATHQLPTPSSVQPWETDAAVGNGADSSLQLPQQAGYGVGEGQADTWLLAPPPPALNSLDAQPPSLLHTSLFSHSHEIPGTLLHFDPPGDLPSMWPLQTSDLTLPGAVSHLAHTDSHPARAMTAHLAPGGVLAPPPPPLGQPQRTLDPPEPDVQGVQGEDAPSQPPLTYLEVPDVTACNLLHLLSGRAFNVVLINTGWEADEADDADGDVQLVSRLRCLPVPQLCPTGFIFIWVQKHHIQAACKQLYSWGYTYVENLTWVWLHPNNSILRRAGTYCCTSHLTLLMFRKEGEGRDIQLRHQRNPDVILDCLRSQPETATSSPPAELYAILETMLPEEVKSGRALELWAPPGVTRPGWMHVAQAPGALPVSCTV